jgi:hypothetical protein
MFIYFISFLEMFALRFRSGEKGEVRKEKGRK